MELEVTGEQPEARRRGLRLRAASDSPAEHPLATQA